MCELPLPIGFLLHRPDSIPIHTKGVCIIGASVAGLSTGLELLRLNPDLKVIIFDRKKYVGENVVCGGAVSLYMMRKVALEIPEDYIAAKIKRVRIHSPDGNFWEGGGGGEYGCVLWRELWERRMAEEFQSLGGELHLNSRLSIRDPTHLCKRFNVVIGADGLTGVTRQFLGLPFPLKDDTHVCVQRITFMDNHPNDRVDLYFGNRVARRGYAWIFPEGWKKQVRVGLGVPLSEDKNPSELLKIFMLKIGTKPISALMAKLLPTAPPPKTGVYGNVVLVGDALPSTDPLTGGGIAQAVASGKAVAKAIIEGKPEKYNNYIGWLRRQNALRYRLKHIVCDLSDQDFNELIAAMKDFKPTLTRISWAMMQALAMLALKKTRMLTRHRVLRRLLSMNSNF